MRSELLLRASRLGSVVHARVMQCCILVLLVVFILTMAYGQTQATSKTEAADATPQRLGEGLAGLRASAQWQTGAGEWDAARAPAIRQGSDPTRTDSALVAGSDSGSGVDA